MHSPYTVPIWKKAPFLRLLLPFMLGIAAAWYLQLPLHFTFYAGFVAGLLYLLFFFFPLGIRFRLQWLQGLLLNLLVLALGMALTWQTDARHHSDWYGNTYKKGDALVIKIDEPLIEKPKSFKATGIIEAVIRNNKVITCKGKIILYFNKDSIAGTGLGYGDKILIKKDIQPIRNTGNPGAFDYERYAAFQQIFHNVFLKQKDWVKLEEKSANPFRRFIFSARDKILEALRKNMTGSKDELGIAQALLIGYTNDLDKDLVQAYSNTGVVHIIAISGMHLALIYVLLVNLFAKIPGVNRSKIIQVMLILSCLWLFSLLTGASASVLRAAVMFTFITIGANLEKKPSIFNSLAASAFVLLCYNPYFLWDVGFQLSYLAVISIIIFQKPVYHCWFIKNKWGAKVWELAAVSLAAQVLTFPVCIYYFHQFPNFFLLTNLVAVPLSSIILYAEIGLIMISWAPVIAPFTGKIVAGMVWLMNQSILWVNRMPFAVWDGISATVLSTWLLYGVVITISGWLINKNSRLLGAALICLLAFVFVIDYGNWQSCRQQKLIVYNISQHRAIDFAGGHGFNFTGDSVLVADAMLQNFNLKPARVTLQLNHASLLPDLLFHQGAFYQFNDKKIFLVDSSLSFIEPAQKIKVDMVVVSKNPKIRMGQLAKVFDCNQYIFDASNSLWKIGKWQKECEELHLRSYSVPGQGAFVLDVER